MLPSPHYLIINALGQNHLGIAPELSRVCTQSGCNLLNLKVNLLGQELAVYMMLSGSWGAIAKMEALLPTLGKQLNLVMSSRRTTDNTYQAKMMHYTLQISAIDRTGILSGISEFLFQMNTAIEEITGHTYINYAGTRMASLSVKVLIPESLHLASFREHFMSYCDEHNFDAFLEPSRQ